MSGFDEKDRLSRELHQRSQAVGGHPIGLDDVKGSARRIQRRRRAAGIVVAAAVLAVAVPVGITVAGTSANRPVPVAHPSPSGTTSAASSASASPTPSESATPSPTATPEAGAVPLTLDGTPGGAAPSLPYLVERRTTTVHHDGVADVLHGSYSDVVSYKGSWLAYAPDANGGHVDRFNTAGEPMDSRPGSGFAVSGDGTQVAWVENGKLMRGVASGMAEGEDSQPLGDAASVSVVGFVPGKVVYTVNGPTPAVHVTDLNGHDKVLAGLVGARGASEAGGFVSGETRYNSDGTSCWVLRDVSTGKDRFPEQCDWTLEAVSPDGRYVVGVPSGTDGIGASRVAIMESATGDVVARFESPRDTLAFVTEMAWEDDTHLLAVTHQQGTWQILRLGVDGSVQTTVGGEKATDTESPYHLGTRS